MSESQSHQPAPTAPGRRLVLSTCFNFRDLGGYRTGDHRQVRWRQLFRSDSLSWLDEGDTMTIDALGLRTVVDLRGSNEADRSGRFPVEQLPVDYHHLPIDDILAPTGDLGSWAEAAFVTETYLEILQRSSSSFATALRLLAGESALPAVFHCSAGKDRSGILAALVLGWLGVPDEVIVSDYELSAEAMKPLLASLETRYADRDLSRYAPAIVSVPAEAMSKFLERLREIYESFEGLAEAFEVTEAVGELRARVLERV